VDLEGTFASHKGQLLARIGNPEEAVKYLKLSYDIFATDRPYNPRELAWCAGNLVNAVATTNAWSDAVKWSEKARDHWLEHSSEHSKDPSEWPAILKKIMGTTLVWAGQRDRAREILSDGMQQVESQKPYNWAAAA
jgi:hypothetical protein